MKDDTDINGWRADWIAQPDALKTSAADLRRRAARQQRRLRAGHILELVAALIFLVFSGVVAWRDPTLESCLWAATVWVNTAAVTAFSVWNWRILWKANPKSVSEYAQDYRKRSVARLRAARFGMGFLVVQVAIAAPWLTWDYFRDRLTGVVFLGSVTVLACLALGFWLMFGRYRRTALQELRELRRSQEVPAE